jgi:ketosteroid isomerase-like protein
MAASDRRLTHRLDYVNLVEQAYFASVRRRDLNGALACFNEDAVFTIQSAFTTYSGRDTEIRGMFERFFRGYTSIIHREFEHVVDLDHDRGATRFSVDLVDAQQAASTMSNCNFFYLENGRFKRVYVYMSGPNILV